MRVADLCQDLLPEDLLSDRPEGGPWRVCIPLYWPSGPLPSGSCRGGVYPGIGRGWTPPLRWCQALGR